MAHAHQHFGAEKVFAADVPPANADMNITPMIDVLLVLLVIFMAASMKRLVVVNTRERAGPSTSKGLAREPSRHPR